uniref:Uncharacterized protein n=1 Tax=Tanacetum cinerariifolium TaxID=118510 RepID=A0A6L2N949_TANCI|nr:hypothetical protein [Tanacetum cinerariifolium]
MDLDVADVSTQPPPNQMDEGFTATAYLKVQENLKLTVEEQVLLQEPASSSGTLSSLQHLTKDLSFGDLFFSDKPSEADNDKATTETKAESMVSVMIQQEMYSIPPMTKLIIDLTLRPKSPKVHQILKAIATETTTTTTTTTILPPPSQQQQSTADAMMMKRIGELKHIMENLIQEKKRLEQRLDSHGARLYTLEQLDIPHRLYEALEKSMNRDHSEELAKDLAEACKKTKKSRESPKMPPGSPPHQPHPPPPPAGPSGASGSPGASGSSQVPPPPPPPPSTNQESQSKGSAAPSSSNTAASVEYQAWTTTDIRLGLSISLTPADLQMDDDMAPDEQAQSSDDEDIGTLASNYSPPPEDSLLAQTGDIAMFMDWFCKRRGITELKPQDLVDDSILRHNVSKPLPLGGPPDLEYLRYGSKGGRPALSISKMKAAYYPDVGLEQMVPDQMWIEEEHLVIRQRVKDFQLGIESYLTQLNLTKPRWDATGFQYKHDYTVIDSPRGVTFRDRYGVQMIMLFNEIHKFSDGTAADWKDVDRSKAFMFAIRKRLKTRRIFRNLESFVGGQVRDGDYRLLKRTE